MPNALRFQPLMHGVDQHMQKCVLKVWLAVHWCDTSTGFSSVVLMLSQQPHTRQVFQVSSVTWTWALNAPESCWCPEFNWPKRRWRDLSPTVVLQVQTHTRFDIYSIAYDSTSFCFLYLSLKVRDAPWWQALLDHTGPFCTTVPSTPGLMQRRWVLKWVALSCS